MKTKNKDEFSGKHFYPNLFYWRDCGTEDTKKACRILNKLTKEQVWAVKEYAQSRYREGNSDGYDTGCSDGF